MRLLTSGTGGELRRGVVIPLTVFTALLVVLEMRFFYLQILHGEDYRERARISVINRERIPPRRGRLLDRHGRSVAENVAAHNLQITPHYVSDPEVRARVLDRLQGLLAWSDAERALLDTRIAEELDRRRRWDPIRVPGQLVADTSPDDGVRLEALSKPLRLVVCPTDSIVYQSISSRATYCPKDRPDGVTINERVQWESDARLFASCPRSKRRFTSGDRCRDSNRALIPVEKSLRDTKTGELYANDVAAVRAVLYDLPGVDVVTEFKRHYPYGYEAAHLIGYMNRVTREDRKKSPGIYGLQDMIGRSGVERSMEFTLRGTSGRALFVRDDRGHRRLSEAIDEVGSGEAFKRAVPGQDVWLSLDMELQKEVSRAFRYYKSGAAVVLDVGTGAVLALYSKPGFDPNVWSGRLSREVWEETIANPYTPLINKAVSAYAPGSVYKIVTAAAAITEETTTPDTTIDCGGFYEYGGRRFHCHHHAGHGSLNLRKALKVSCDVYFYRVGEMLGMDKLAEYGALFGYGQSTGAQIGERTGRLPTREWHKTETTLGWQPGFTLSTAVGQGSLTATPLQVARAYVAIANGGELLDVQVVDRWVNEDGEVTKRFGRNVTRRLAIDPKALEIIHEGLIDVVNAPDGTASELALEDVLMAGKTGTAEAAQARRGVSGAMKLWLLEDHAWFAAYVPAEAPEVVVVVFVEHGGSGSKRAGPIARRIVQAWARARWPQHRAKSEQSPAGAPEMERTP